jgi:hypothetical protein
MEILSNFVGRWTPATGKRAVVRSPNRWRGIDSFLESHAIIFPDAVHSNDGGCDVSPVFRVTVTKMQKGDLRPAVFGL